MSDSSDEDGDFGQKLPPLHIYLKRVLDKYPEGGQILKELVQNADDANARNVVFLYDKSEHPSHRLWSDTLREFQGPALYAYNDATFEKADWHNIQHPEQSGKLDDLAKVGRFGLGFISVYHLTDMPCIISGNKIGFLDPLEQHFNHDPHTNIRYKGRRGKKWKMSASLFTKFPDQFSPFLNDLFKCNEVNFHDGKLEGTIFRFPLRRRSSLISKSVFNDDARVQGLLESFQRDAEISLLFLKHVESITVYERHQRQESPRLVCKVQIHPEDCHQVRLNRSQFLSQIPPKLDSETVSCVNIQKQLGPQAVVHSSRYITVNTLKITNASRKLKELINDDDLKLLPWMGVSFRISATMGQGSSVDQNGRVFCFLPLPESEQTGLPVHVHGYFGLGDNRRSIKWPDQESLHDNKAIWNQLLSTEVFPDVYSKVILAAIDKSKDPKDPMQPADVYIGWPHLQSIKAEWSDGVKNFLKCLKDKPIVFTNYKGGSWMKPSEVYIDPKKSPLISKVLLHKGYPVAHIPDHVVKSLQALAGEHYKEVTPAVVRARIRGDPLQFLTRKEKLELLKYVTSDTICDLNNLMLLPLQNGDFVCFSKTAPRVYIETTKSPSKLIPNGGHRFAASELPDVLTKSNVQSHTQLKILNIEDVAGLLRDMLPSTWRKGTEDTVPWTPGSNQNPSEGWLEDIWKWLTQNNMLSELGSFNGIPLIPVAKNHLARLQERMIFKERRGDSRWVPSVCVSDNICSFLESLDAVVVRHDLPSYIMCHPHLNTFIKAPTPEGVMTILNICSKRVNLQTCVHKLTASAKDEVRCLLAQLQSFTATTTLNILRSLPLFRTSSGQYVSVQTGMTAVPGGNFGIPVSKLRRPHLVLRSDGSDNILYHLGVRNKTADEFVANDILPAVDGGFYSDEDSLKIMIWVLERSEFDKLVTQVKFIPTCGSKAKPMELFEPNSILCVLFRGNDVFPTGVFSEDRLLTALKRVGLKKEADVTAADVLKCAIEVSKTQAGRADVERGSSLLFHINCYPHLLNENVTSNRITKPLHKFLADLCWVPCKASPPPGYPASAGWAVNCKALYTPRQVGLIESALLQGSVLPLFKLVGIREELLNAFSWSKQVDYSNYHKVELVVLHLKNVASNYSSTEENFAISKSLSLIYTFLGKAADVHITDIFRRCIGTSQPWVWHGSGFTTPDKMAFSIGTLGVNLTPYLHIVPTDFRKPQNTFLAKMGVRQTFQESALCAVLLNVQQKHEGGQVSSKDCEADLHLVCNILRHIGTLDMGAWSDIQKQNIIVPCRVSNSTNLRMARASECLYVDEERLAKQLLGEGSLEDFSTPIIHELIPNSVAQHLEMKPLSHVIAPVEALNYAYDLAGPHETTVNAIKRNLDMYKKGVDIFKELIQNADDAGATEVKFLIDWRRNEQTANNLLSEGMKACHGPALWAYNNACFSDQDIHNICSIAEQSKKQQLDKVGRFGLGFTSVYHLTDVPSVVSGPYVLICDPRTTHLGSRVSSGQPGIKLDLRNEGHQKTLKIYPNQFQPYNDIFGCNLKNPSHFKHTLFRLPLRTRIEADGQSNQLSEYVCDTKKEVDPLIESLKRSAATLLLFTQNVVHVSVHELQSSENVGDMKNVMSVTLSRVLQTPRTISGPISDMQTERKLLKATTACVETSVSSPVPETTMIVEIRIQETFQLGRGGKKKSKTKVCPFIISSCMARGQALDLALTNNGRKAGVLPCGGVAAQLCSGERGLTPECTMGNAFSYLSLDVKTGLPFHVNGDFLLQPNRRQLWSKPSSGTGEFETTWNTCFMESVLLRAFLNLLEDFKQLQEQHKVDVRNFQCLWPRRNTCQSDFYPFVDAFYQMIGSETNAPAVIFNQSQWVSVHDCFFTDWSETCPKVLRDSISILLAKHQDPKRCVELNPDVASSIVQAGANKCFDNNTFNLQRFLKEVFFPMLQGEGDIEPTHRNNIVLHMLDLRLGDRNVKYDSILKDTDCIPTSPEGEDLASPDELVNPCKLIGSLYNENDSRFPHGEGFRDENRLLSLAQLGMASTDLPWEDICERAESIAEKGNFDQRSMLLLKFIDEKLQRNENPTSEQKIRIREAAFLPVLQRPQSYPVEWYPCDLELKSADELQESRHKDLLGSVKPLLDEMRLGSDAMTQRVKTFLGCSNKQVDINDVIHQLEVLINHEIKLDTSSMAYSIYSFLEKKVCAVSEDCDQVQVREECRAAVDHLSALGFIVCDGKFKDCKALAFHFDGKNGPYLYQVPRALTPFSNLLRICGVRDRFEVEDFLRTLYHLKQKYKENEPLHESDLKVAKAMLSEIVSRCAAHGNIDHKRCNLEDERIFVPDISGILQAPSNLTFNDMPWEDCQKNKVYTYTHPDISYRDAKVLGIETQREKLLDTCSTFEGFETDFGQSEQLTERLSNILRSYPNVSDVFKELLQNADDAGCTEIHFVYDPRSHPTEKIISPSWAAVQKLPSLCVYNDMPFTEADIKGIQKVGVGSKRDDIATTGKFGIGFNAVYHLTDCPTFLSKGDTLCLFDPLLEYIPGVQQQSPGKRFSTDAQFREKFPEMFTGYLEDIDGFAEKAGTVFRFPLRKKPSVISEQVFSSCKVNKLLDDFQKVSQEALLFLNNIKKITISRIGEHPDKLATKYCIRAKLSDEGEHYRVQLTGHLKLFKDRPCETIAPMSHVYNLKTEDSMGTEQSWLISQMIGFGGLSLDGKDLSSAACLKKPIPRGGVAALIKDSKVKSLLNQEYKAYCFLPLPIHTKLPVHVNGTFELDSARKNLAKGDDYVRADDPVDEDRLIHRWNRLLLENVIGPAYAQLLMHAGRKILGVTEVRVPFQHQLDWYNGLFPKNLTAVHGEWLLLTQATLRHISQENLEVLPVVRPGQNGMSITWHHPNSETSQAFFDGFDEKHKPAADTVPHDTVKRHKTNICSVLRSFLLEVGFNLVASSPEICLAFQGCGVDQAKFVTPKAVVQHLSSDFVVASTLPTPLKQTHFKYMSTFHKVFKYCLSGISQPTELNDLPLRLTNDSMLSEFSAIEGVYVTAHCDVLPCLKDKFLHKELVPSCTAWFEKNKISEEAFSSGIFKQFTIFELAQYMDKQLPENWQGCDRHVMWTPGTNGHPSELWLRNLWAFICSETFGEKSQSSLEALDSWPMFPTLSHQLVPPSLSKTVLFLQWHGVGLGTKIADALRKLGLPEIAQRDMCSLIRMQQTTGTADALCAPAGLDQLLETQLAQSKSQQDVTSVIQFMLETAGVNDISISESDTLLLYFQEGEELSQQSIQTIKQLKIFKLLQEEKTTDLHHVEHYHTVEGYEMLMIESQTWMDHMHCVFLEPRRHLCLLYDQLKVTPITHADIYLRYILPSFNLLSQEVKLKHVEYIRDKVLPNTSIDDQKALLQCLSCTPIILDGSNILRPAGYFFDPANLIFKAMVDPSKLLPDSVKRLRYFLEKIGLHTKVTQEDFIKFAKEVETRAKSVKDKNKRKKLIAMSNLLTNELDLNEGLLESCFLQKIAKIKFIPSVQIKAELLGIYPAYCGSHNNDPNRPPFIAYHGAVPERYLELVWSVSMIIPRQAIPRNSEVTKGVSIHHCLGIETEVLTEKVLSHTQNICGLIESKNATHKEDTLSMEMRKTVEDVLNRILGYLTDLGIPKHGAEIKHRLQCTPICLVEERRVLVRADQLVFDMEKGLEHSLRPYLYKAPRELANFDSVLRLLGAQDSCSFDQLAGVLSAMKNECNDDHLSPNERTTAVSAVTAIFVLLGQGKCEITVPELYLPSSEDILRKASSLYYADQHLLEHFKLVSTDKEFIFPLKQCGIADKDEMTLIPLLPEPLQPKNIGSKMKEKPCETNKDCHAGENCEYANHIKRILNSEEMTRVLLRLTQHQSDSKQQRQTTTADTKARITKLQTFHKVLCKLELKLAFYDAHGDKIANEKFSRKAYFEIDTGTMYLKHFSLFELKSRTFSQIAKSCNVLLGQLLDHEHIGYLTSALDCTSLDEMNATLSESSIPEYDTTTQAVQQDVHRPGTIVHSDIRHLLDHDPCNRFMKDEIVGYERFIDERSHDERNPDEFLPPSDGTAVLGTAASYEDTEIIYAKIIELVDQDVNKVFSSRYKIDIGQHEPVIVKVTALYKFLRPKEPPIVTVVPFTGETTDEVPKAVFDDALPEDLHRDEEQIKMELDEAFELPPEERRRVLKRLYRKWHPDKNIGQEERACKAFKFLKQEIDRREKGDRSSQCCSDRYSYWESEVSRDREEARRYQDKYYKSQSSARESTSDRTFVPPSFTRETPDPRTARLWFRQAKEHFNTAEQASQQRSSPSQLIAFQIHQATESALKAAQYSLDGRADMNSNDLISLARKVCQHRDVHSDELLAKVRELDSLGCEFNKPRYPQKCTSQTSGQVYHAFNTDAVLGMCKELLSLVQDIIGINIF